MASHHIIDWKPAFLASLRETPVVYRACEAADVNRSTVYRARESDPEFAAAWDDAMEDGIDKAEQEAFRRAVDGVDKGVWYMGSLVGQERVYSDSLLALLLKGRRKKVYADRTELTGADGGPIKAVDDTARSARVAQLMAIAQQRKALQDAENALLKGIEDLV